MKLTLFLLTVFVFSAQAKITAQQVTISGKHLTAKQVFTAIEKQTGYVVFTKSGTIPANKTYTLSVYKLPLTELMNLLVRDQPIKYAIEDKTIVISPVNKVAPPVQQQDIKIYQDDALPVNGRVLTPDGQPLEGASVRIKGTKKGTTTDSKGNFNIEGNSSDVLVVSYTGFKDKEVRIAEMKSAMVIELEVSDSKLDAIQVIAYGTTTKRLNTGSVVSVKSEEITKNPVNNPLLALAGRVTGAVVTQTSGNIGAGVNIQIRGLNSISQGSAPLYIVDGVPFLNNYIGPGISLLVGANNSGQTPFSTINPADIASIEILKDADATAIYGSRGANGVVLITTKAGNAGNSVVEANVNSGFGSVSRKIEMMNTAEYLAMRREAYANDQREITSTRAPDVLLWDNNRYTDWQEKLIGGTARYYNANFSVSGGNAQTRFRAAANYNKETTVYPGDFSGKRGGISLGVNHKSKGGRFYADFLSQYSSDRNNLPTFDLTSQISLSPNAPSIYDANGGLNWQENGASFFNPYSLILNDCKTVMDNINSSAKLRYIIGHNLELLASGGISIVTMKQDAYNYKAAQNPVWNPEASAEFATTSTQSWIIEPQLKYKRSVGPGNLEVLLGTTIQKRQTDQQRISASGFPNDELITASAFATNTISATSIVDYRYLAFFGRLNYNISDKYILNATARRDGSSRFGPGKQWGDFGAIGAAWIFSSEEFIKGTIPAMSFGKIRGSIGVTGNDQIGDYQFRDNYRNTSYPYQAQVGYIPSRIFNADYAWERNRKMEAALDLGFFNDRVLFTVNFYNHISGNQLINYSLPSQTGFSSVLKNFEALVQNQGWEFELGGRKDFANGLKWSASFNVSFNRNKLKSFPNLEKSTYANSLVIGQPVNILKKFNLTGVDPATGVYTFSGTVYPTDLVNLSNINPKFFGGLNNQFTYKDFDFSFLFQFVKRDGYNYDAAIYFAPGGAMNLPKYYLDRWTKPGQVTDIQRFTTTGPAYTAHQNYNWYSNGIISVASFIRLKNVALSYTLKPGKIGTVKLYLQGQNLWTITRYKGLDPETADMQGLSLPTLKVWNIGARIIL